MYRGRRRPASPTWSTEDRYSEPAPDAVEDERAQIVIGGPVAPQTVNGAATRANEMFAQVCERRQPAPRTARRWGRRPGPGEGWMGTTSTAHGGLRSDELSPLLAPAKVRARPRCTPDAGEWWMVENGSSPARRRGRSTGLVWVGENPGFIPSSSLRLAHEVPTGGSVRRLSAVAAQGRR